PLPAVHVKQADFGNDRGLVTPELLQDLLIAQPLVYFDGDVAPHQRKLGYFVIGRQRPAAYSVVFEFEQYGRSRQIILLLPTRVQFPYPPGILAIDDDSGALARVQGRVSPGLELRLPRREQRFHIALHVVEIAGAPRAPPLLGQRVAMGDAGHPHRLTIFPAGAGDETARDLEQPHPGLPAAQVAAQAFDEAAREAGAHDGEMARDRIGERDRAVVPAEIALPLGV